VSLRLLTGSVVSIMLFSHSTLDLVHVQQMLKIAITGICDRMERLKARSVFLFYETKVERRHFQM
jgi:hypothetical protein